MGFGDAVDNMQTICTVLQTDNHTNTSSLKFYTPDALPDAQPVRRQQQIYQRHKATTYGLRYGCSALSASSFSGSFWSLFSFLSTAHTHIYHHHYHNCYHIHHRHILVISQYHTESTCRLLAFRKGPNRSKIQSHKINTTKANMHK